MRCCHASPVASSWTLCVIPKYLWDCVGWDLSFDISEHRKFMEIPYWDVTVQKWKNFFLVPHFVFQPLPFLPWAQVGQTRPSAGWRGWTLTRWDQKVPGFIWVFPKIGVPQNGWFIMENLIKMDDLGIPLFLETSIWYITTHDWKQDGWKSILWKSSLGVLDVAKFRFQQIVQDTYIYIYMEIYMYAYLYTYRERTL